MIRRTLTTIAARRASSLFERPLRASADAVGAPLSRRTYLGGAGEPTPRAAIANDDDVARREQLLWDKARPRYDEIKERHLRLPTSTSDETKSGDGAENADLAVRKKRLVYRSKQRGWLEVDLLLGTWASENVERLDASELDEFEDFVNMETIDIYNIITLRIDVPEEMKSEGSKKNVVEQIQEWAKESPLGKADAEKYKEVKKNNNLI